MLPQPDDMTCGPTCLHAVYRYYGDELSLTQVIGDIRGLEEGGTLSVMLACDALRRGYSAAIYSYNLALFDPTWYSLPMPELADRLTRQAAVKPEHRKLQTATQCYLEFLRLGGEVRFRDLNVALLRKLLRRGVPIITGLSATFLYHCEREVPDSHAVDAILGEPVGHFVVLCGYDAKSREVLVADPLTDRPDFEGHVYPVPIDRVVGAILLGVLTHDAELLILEPPRREVEASR